MATDVLSKPPLPKGHRLACRAKAADVPEAFPDEEVQIRIWPGAPEPLEQIWVGGLRFRVARDGYCYDRDLIRRLFRWLESVARRHGLSHDLPKSQLREHLGRSFAAGQRLMGWELLLLCDQLGSRSEPELAESILATITSQMVVDDHPPDLWVTVALPYSQVDPDQPAAGEQDLPKHPLNYVLRRLIGVMFLTPVVLIAPTLCLLCYLVLLGVAPHRTLSTYGFRLREAVGTSVRFAYYEDFTTAHAEAVGVTLLGYLGVIAWALWFPVSAVPAA
ncbi:MAG: hypothetical protein HY319_32130 [Armatimonadetes bacterium]|nr:hypothetical protein [Armatimonadota bacterium]